VRADYLHKLQLECDWPDCERCFETVTEMELHKIAVHFTNNASRGLAEHLVPPHLVGQDDLPEGVAVLTLDLPPPPPMP
jgi:hypothetical protein